MHVFQSAAVLLTGRAALDDLVITTPKQKGLSAGDEGLEESVKMFISWWYFVHMCCFVQVKG